MPLPQALIYSDRGNPKYEVTNILRCPVIKFVGYMVSYVTFLTLITVATFRLDRSDLTEEDEENWEIRSAEIWSYDFRTSNVVMTKIQIILLFWMLGQLGMECKQVYYYGLRYFFRSYYNIMDWAAIALYLASYSLRIIVDFKVQTARAMYINELRIAQGLLDNSSLSTTRPYSDSMPTIHDDYVAYRNQILTSSSAYWLRGCRLWWAPDDPEYVSDCLFALGNVLSFARISHLMPAWELLGPLQISLARMVSDIIRFMALFSVMVIAFVVGLTNLYWYFANIIVSVDMQGRLIRYASGIPAFRSTGATFYTLYWALFGQSSNNVTTIDENLAKLYPGHAMLAVESSPLMINNLGSVLYAIYNACMTIILLNMLIAMMSKSFDEIQGDRLEEWKFARASLWMVYIDQEGVLPPPLNLLPSREVLSAFFNRIRGTLAFSTREDTFMIKANALNDKAPWRNVVWANQFQNRTTDSNCPSPKLDLKKNVTTTTVSTAVDCSSPVHSNSWVSDDEETLQEDPEKAMNDFKHFTDTMRANVLRRFLFKLQKQREAENKTADLSIINYQRQQAQKASEKDNKRKQETMQEDDHAQREGKLRQVNDMEPSQEHSTRPESDACEDTHLRGLSSLLMPPSVRKKLEAVAAASSGDNDLDGKAATEAVARYYMLETTRKQANSHTVESTHFERNTKWNTSSWKPNPDDLFTARTERPIKGIHLRELYRVEQELNDMAEALSSHSLSEATISEINELEKI
ncbi:unnamed protein product [Dicrocoelium dendriticum]|nr:unnamed protein product [Dicrocoelium dendriticum]